MLKVFLVVAWAVPKRELAMMSVRTFWGYIVSALGVLEGED